MWGFQARGGSQFGLPRPDWFLFCHFLDFLDCPCGTNSGRFQGVPNACARINANPGEVWRTYNAIVTRTALTFTRVPAKVPTFARVPVKMPSVCGWPSEYAQQTVLFSLLRPPKTTKMAGVTQAKAWFRKSQVCSSLTIVHVQYDWTTGMPGNANEWRKFLVVPPLPGCPLSRDRRYYSCDAPL